MSPDAEFSIEVQKLIDSYCTKLTMSSYTIEYENQNIKVKLGLSVTPVTKVKVMKKALFDAM